MMTPKRRRIDGDVQDEIQNKARLNWAPAQIDRWLRNEKDDTGKEKFAGRIPDIRTIQRIVRETVPSDSSGMWHWEEDDPDITRLVFDTLRAVVPPSEGRVMAFTKDQAKEIARLRRVVPDMNPYVVYMLALSYLARRARKEDTADLDYFLAFAPWQGEEAFKEYIRACENKWIPIIHFERLLDMAEKSSRRETQQNG